MQSICSDAEDVLRLFEKVDLLEPEQFRLTVNKTLTENVSEGTYVFLDRLLRQQVEQDSTIEIFRDLSADQQRALDEFIENYPDNMFFVVPIYKIILTQRNEDGLQSAIFVMRKGQSLADYLQEHPEESAAIYPYLVSFVSTCNENGFFHLAIHPSSILIEPLDYTITDCLDNSKQITLRQYHFRFTDFLNMTRFSRLDSGRYQLGSPSLLERLSEN